MSDRQVPRSEWPDFFRQFSERHQDRPVTVRVFGERLGNQVEARELPLEGIVVGRVPGSALAIHVGSRPNQNVEHRVGEPVRVWVEADDNGDDMAVEIESKDGTMTLVVLEPPVSVCGCTLPS